MTKAKKIYLLVVLLGGSFLFFRYYETQSILSVFSQKTDAFRNAKLRMLRDGRIIKTGFNQRRYINALYNIDTSRCPKDFQFAWLGYVQAYERFKKTENMSIIDDFASVVTYSPTFALGGIPKVVQSGDEWDWAKQNLERVALEYNVRIIHN